MPFWTGVVYPNEISRYCCELLQTTDRIILIMKIASGFKSSQDLNTTNSDILAPSLSNKKDQRRFHCGGPGIEEVLIEFEENIRKVSGAINT